MRKETILVDDNGYSFKVVRRDTTVILKRTSITGLVESVEIERCDVDEICDLLKAVANL